MDFRLLGPLEVFDDDGRELSVGAGRQRALLALLLLSANELVASDRLTDELWGESPPPTAHRMLLNQVSALRRVLGRDGRLETRGSAYCLHIGPGERDVDRFEELLAQGRACRELDPERAAAALQQALSLWRGSPLSDFAYEPFAQLEIARLQERRLVAYEERVDAELGLGRHGDLVAELEDLVARHPLRERLQGQLMLALYRCGRQAEALQVYMRARKALVEDIGAEPGPDLRALQAAILAQDHGLDFRPAERELPPALDEGSPLFAGRREELADLRQCLAAARDGRGGLVLISGRPGIGKTRLAAELAREALRVGMDVLYAGLGSMFPDDALGAVRRAASLDRPALLVLDDVDDASLPVLTAAEEVARTIPARRLLVLALQRDPVPPPALVSQTVRHLALEPLTPGAVAEIAALYGSPGGTAMPAHMLIAESAGIPLQAHRAANEWAREEAAQRLVTAAARAETERDEARATEAELAANVIELQSARTRGRLYRLEHLEPDAGDGWPPAPAVCPFMGLATFDSAHAEYFFGRERLVAEMVTRLVGTALLAVVGPSGSGKSSVVRAGLLPALADGALPGSERARALGRRTGRRLGPPTPMTRGVPQRVVNEGEDVLVAFAARGRQLVTMSQPEGETIVRDATSLRPIRRLRASGLPWASAISPDGRFAALGRDDGSIRLVDLRTGSSRTPSARHDGSVQGAAFTPDSNTLVTVGDDAKVIVWDVHAGRQRATFAGQGGRIAGVAVSPDGRTAYSASFDGTVVAWDLAGSRRLGEPFLTSPRKSDITISETGIEIPNGASYNLGVSPHGEEIAVALANGDVNLIDTRTLRVRGRIHALSPESPPTAATFAPDGRTIAITGIDGSLRFWDSRTLAPLSPVLHAGPAPSFSPRFTPDGRFVITKGLDWVLRLWDVRRHTVVRKLQLRLFPQDGDVRPDGKVVAFPECARDIGSCTPTQAQESHGPSAQGEDGVEIFSLPSLRPVARIPMRSGRWARFSRDGRLLIVGNHEGRAQLYDGHTFRPVGRPLLGHTGFILTADFGPDGRTVATSSSDGTIRLWDTATSRPIGTPLPGVPDVQVGVAFIHGGTHIVAVYDGGQGYVWDVRPSSWARYACAIAGRTLTRPEWQQFLPGRSYAPACGTP